jgi:hypothetical protein
MRDYIAFAFLAFVTKIDGVEHQTAGIHERPAQIAPGSLLNPLIRRWPTRR